MSLLRQAPVGAMPVAPAVSTPVGVASIAVAQPAAVAGVSVLAHTPIPYQAGAAGGATYAAAPVTAGMPVVAATAGVQQVGYGVPVTRSIPPPQNAVVPVVAGTTMPVVGGQQVQVAYATAAQGNMTPLQQAQQWSAANRHIGVTQGAIRTRGSVKKALTYYTGFAIFFTLIAGINVMAWGAYVLRLWWWYIEVAIACTLWGLVCNTQSKLTAMEQQPQNVGGMEGVTIENRQVPVQGRGGGWDFS